MGLKYRIIICIFFPLFYLNSYIGAQCPVLTWTTPASMPSMQVIPLSYPVVGTNDDGRLEVFVIANDGALWHTWQVQGNNNQWSEWASFGFPPNSPLRGSLGRQNPNVTVSKDKYGRLQVFVTNGTVWQIGQVSKNVNWNSWRSLGSPQSPVGLAEAVWSITNADGRIELFIQNSGNHSLQHMWQLADGNSWNGAYTEFGWPVGDRTDFNLYTLALSLDLSGRIELATAPFPGPVQIRRQRIPNADWEDWQSVGTPFKDYNFQNRVSLGKNADGRLELAAVSMNGVWHTWQGLPQNNSAPPWTGQWASFGDPTHLLPDNSFSNTENMQLIQGPGECLALFVSGLYQNQIDKSLISFLSQNQPSSGWGTWVKYNPSPMQTYGFTVAKGIGGELHLFMINSGPGGGILTSYSH